MKHDPQCEFSPDGCLRYWLKWRTGLDDSRILLFIGANPSKAGQVVDGKVRSDPTVSRMRNLAHELGFGALWVVNVRAWISTDPSGVPADPMAIGPLNDYWIEIACNEATLIVCAWGHLAGKERASEVMRIVRDSGKVPHVLALTQDGTPRHPRAIPSSAIPFPLPMQVQP